MHPIAYAVLNNPAALSLSSALSPRPSFSYTPSMISDSKGTKITEHATPNSPSPVVEMAKLL
jgi:hypothetical protein